MPFNISTFKSSIDTYGYLSTNKFSLYVTPPNAIFGGKSIISTTTTETSLDISKQLVFRVDSVVVPSITLALADTFRYGVGVPQKQPFNAGFNIINLTFISDGYGSLWDFWYQWLQAIFNFSGNDSGGNAGPANASGNFSLKYKDDYSTDITIAIFDIFGNQIKTITYTQAFPFTVNDIPLNWNESHQLLKINVGIAFTNFTIVNSSLK